MKIITSSILIALFVNLLIPLVYAAENSDDQFKAYIIISDKPDEENPNRKTVREFVIGETAYCAFVASGMGRNENNEVNLYASVEFITPENKALFSETRYAHTKTVLPTDQKMIVLKQSFDVGFDSTDILGMYTLKLTITDSIAKKTASTETTILLFSSAKAKEIVMSPVKSAKHLDELWALYFETKNKWAVRRIISAIRLKDAKDLERTLIGRAAIWSLESNAYQHPDVYRICKDQLQFTENLTKELLNEILAKVDARKLNK